VIRSIGHGLTVAMLCASIGLHWIALQSVAWGKMIVTYSQSCLLSEAVTKTFDGKHPCDLCKHISGAQHAPKKPEAQPSVAKPVLICTVTPRFLRNAWKHFEYASHSVPINERRDRPAIPPPRLVG
jgi:hypothetical protein